MIFPATNQNNSDSDNNLLDKTCRLKHNQEYKKKKKKRRRRKKEAAKEAKELKEKNVTRKKTQRNTARK
jgi:hypothetical protein